MVQIWARKFGVRSRTGYALFSSGTNLSSKIRCTNLGKIHFETDTVIKLLLNISVYKFGQDSFRESLINQSLTQLSTFPTRHWESRNDTLFSSGTNLDKIPLRTDSLINLINLLHSSQCWYKFGLEDLVYIFGQDSF